MEGIQKKTKSLEKKIFSNVLHFKQDSSLIIIILVAFVFILVCCASTLKYGFVKPILATSRFALFIKDTSFTFFFFLFFFKCFLQFTVNICDNVWKIKSSNMLEVYKLVVKCKKTHLLKLWLKLPNWVHRSSTSSCSFGMFFWLAPNLIKTLTTLQCLCRRANERGLWLSLSIASISAPLVTRVLIHL